jgi:tetratricopeptide (TPR) repeat protein
MVIDNADDMGLFFKRSHELSHTISDESNLQRYLPECPHGTLLLTTRDKQVAVNFGKGSLPIELKHMDNGECEDLLRTRLGDMSSIGEELATLAANLEFLPLALVQAAAFIQQNCITVEQYIELQGKSDQHLVELLSEEFETVGRDTETPRAVAQTWVLSFQQIKKQNPLAARLLSLMSLLDRQGIPKELLSNYIKGSDLDLVKAFGLLKAFSLVVEGKGGTFDMHRLVYLVTRKWLSNEGTISSFHKEALAMLSQEFPRGAAFENRTKCAAYLPHAKAVVHPESIALEGEVDIPPTLSNNLGGYFVIQGMWHDAEVFCRQAVEASKIQLGADHGDTLAIMNDLALVFMGRGRWEEAEQLGMQALEASKMHLGADHPHTLTSMNILASVFRKQGRWEEAEQLVMQALEASKTQLGEDHPDTLLSMSSLALIFEQQGRWEEAEKLQVQAVEASKTRLGAHHSDTLISMNILASVFEKQGRLEEAEKLELQVWEAFKVQLGPDHPSTLTNMTNLALIYKKQGRWEEAAQLGTQALEGFKIQLGADHPNTLSAMHNLAFTWYRIGKISEAIDLLQTCVDLRKVKLGLDHPSTQSSISALERWERKRKRERKSNT